MHHDPIIRTAPLAVACSLGVLAAEVALEMIGWRHDNTAVSGDRKLIAEWDLVSGKVSPGAPIAEPRQRIADRRRQEGLSRL